MKKKLFDAVSYAYKSIQLYRDYAIKKGFSIDKYDQDDSFETIPTIDRNEYMMTESNDCCDDIIYMDNVSVVSTSGSTGKVLDICYSDYEYNKSLFGLWLLRKKWYGINTTDRVCSFYENSFNGEQTEDSVTFYENETKLAIYKNNITLKNIVNVYNKIKEFSPKWMIIQPSMATLLCEGIIEYNLTNIPSIKYIEMTGEILSDYCRSFVENVLKCKVINQYGCVEVNSIAYECPHGHLHCMDQNVYVEILKDSKAVEDGEEGTVYLTSYNNKIMPFVRYNLGDKARFIKEIDCEYSKVGKAIELTRGRENDLIFFRDGSKLSAYIFYEIVQKVNSVCRRLILQFQVEQTDYEEFIVRLVINKKVLAEVSDIDNIISNTFLEEIKLTFDKLSTSKYSFEFYDILLCDDKSGKLKYFISHVDFES